MSEKTLFLTFSPRALEDVLATLNVVNGNYLPYDFLINPLVEKGVKIDYFSEADLKCICDAPSTELLDFLRYRLEDAGLIIHDASAFRTSFISSMDCGNSIPFSSKDNSAEWLSERLVNNFLYFEMPHKTEGLWTPPDIIEEDIREKRYLPEILTELDIKTPKTIWAPDFNGDFFPAVLKMTHSACGKDVHYVNDGNDWEIYTEAIGPFLPLYVVQEKVDLPTRFPVNFRTVCFADNVLGGMVYYNTQSNLTSNGTCKSGRGISLTSENLLVFTKEDNHVLSSYGMDGLSIPFGIPGDSQKIADYTSERGCQMIGIDFLVSQAGLAYCVDVTQKPGIGFYNICFNGNGKRIPSNELRELQGKIISAAALKKFFDN